MDVFHQNLDKDDVLHEISDRLIDYPKKRKDKDKYSKENSGLFF